jgi:hypothetical protein
MYIYIPDSHHIRFGSTYPIPGIARANQGPSVNGKGVRIALELAEGKKKPSLVATTAVDTTRKN